MNSKNVGSEIMEQSPDTSVGAVRDRAIGALLGLAVGDAVGTTLEFKVRDSYTPLTDMIGGGPFGLKPGEWTDDTAMALALADSLYTNDALDEVDLITRFVNWHENGAYSCTGDCFDIGITTRNALQSWQRTGIALAGLTDPETAGNGSLMRLAPVAVRFWNDPSRLRDVAARQGRTTHQAPAAVDACVAYAELLADAIAGQSRSVVLRNRDDASWTELISTVMAGSWRAKSRDVIDASGYVVHSLEASLWSIDRTSNFKEAVLLAANLGQDADTTAAITGQLAGALEGVSGIPSSWLSKLAWRPRITGMADALFARSIVPN